MLLVARSACAGPWYEDGAVDWSHFESRQPRLAELGWRRLLSPGVVLVVTIRRDGTPRLSPVEPYLMDGRLWLSMLWRSRKAQDLLRDDRVLVHSVVSNRDGGEGEFKLRGSARKVDDESTQQRYAVAVGRDLGWHPVPGQFHLFVVDIDLVTYIRYDDATGDQFTAMWPPAREFVRRGVTATSLGPPEDQHQLLDVHGG
jgi:Pyridoxamine 5'-phosphate oxidase